MGVGVGVGGSVTKRAWFERLRRLERLRTTAPTRRCESTSLSFRGVLGGPPPAVWWVGLIAVLGVETTLGIACGDAPARGADAGLALDSGAPRPDAAVLPRVDGGPATDGGRGAPSLFRVTPAFGRVEGGTRVVLQGALFEEPVEVFFGSRAATDVVLLDGASMAATSPPGELGTSVAVRVLTPGGEAVREAAFRYQRTLRIDRVTPDHVFDEGGTFVRIEGAGFDEHTLALVDRKPLSGARVVDESEIVGYAPPLRPGRPQIMVVHPEAIAERSDLLVVRGRPRLTAIVPGYGPITGSTQRLAGRNLAQVESVKIDGLVSVSFEPIDEGTLEIAVPASSVEVGVHAVEVEAAGSASFLRNRFITYDPAATSLQILGVLPASLMADASGTTAPNNQVVTLVGSGFSSEVEVWIGGLRAVTATVAPHAVEAWVPGGVPVGPASVTLRASHTSTAAIVLETGLVVKPELAVLDIEPAHGPALGGTSVTLEGRGFSPGCWASIGAVPLGDIVVVSDQEMRGRTVAGAHGPADVRVTCAHESDAANGADGASGGLDGSDGAENAASVEAILADGFTFQAPFEIVRMDPTEGSIAGNTYVSVFGNGLTTPNEVRFGTQPAALISLENGSILGLRTPRKETGEVSVEATWPTAAESTTLTPAFAFYNPRLVTGGAYGGEIRGSVNVAVMTPSGDALSGMWVQLGEDGDARLARPTDEDGLATISDPSIRGPQTVTVGGTEVEFVTFSALNAQNLTVVATPFPANPPEDAPIDPCPESASPPVVRGRVFKLKSSIDPATNPELVPVVFVTYSQPSPFQSNPSDVPGSPPPLQTDQVFSEGDAYEIAVRRTGVVSVYAVFGNYNTETGEYAPLRMGLVRNVAVAAGQVVEGIDLALEIPLDQQAVVRLNGLPGQYPGPAQNAVFTYLNLGSDGVIAPGFFTWGTGRAVDGDRVELDGLPDLSAPRFVFSGGAFTRTSQGTLGRPFSLNVRSFGGDLAEGVDLGPFVGMPQDLAPKAGQILTGGAFEWAQPGLEPDLTVIRVQDTRFIGGQCCVDDNVNGICEPDEEVQGGLAFPLSFVRWSLYAPGGRTRYVMPPVVAGEVSAFERPNAYGYTLEQAVVPRFRFDEFSSTQFSPYFWESWSVTQSWFIAKEETD
ncbi:MAG: hypothetical protein IPK13_21200 [Deltaproteobacteria bacterium]|nr:hypothetical protein [Deltaproteobacteria bacterium]